jgi:Fic family protein
MPRKYIHQLADWPEFQWDQEQLLNLLAQVRHDQGRLVGRVEALGFTLRTEAELKTLTLDVLKSSEIEGEILDVDQVRSSVARRLGIDIGGLEPVDRHVDGLVEMMLNATRQYQDSLTTERLFDWHAAMFPSGRSGMTKISVGAWRADASGPMRVISGPLGNENVHFEAPAAHRIDEEMSTFLDWIESDAAVDPVLKAGLAHLWFVTIHPFDDGNGRLARAITDMMLSRSEQSSQRFYSMSTQIRKERKDYYQILEQTQSGSMDVTDWIEWFLSCLSRALGDAQDTLSSVLRKAEFWNRLRSYTINSRQQKMLNRILDDEFKGKLTTSKWAKMTKCSQDTAHRDILELMKAGFLSKNPGGGRSTSYSLADE